MLSWCCCHSAYCDAASVLCMRFIFTLWYQRDLSSRHFSKQTEFLFNSETGNVNLDVAVLCRHWYFMTWHADRDVQSSRWFSPTLQASQAPLLAAQVRNELVGWDVGGWWWSHYTVDYPILSTGNCETVIPPFVGLSLTGRAGGTLEPAGVGSFQPFLPRVLTLTLFHTHTLTQSAS